MPGSLSGNSFLFLFFFLNFKKINKTCFFFLFLWISKNQKVKNQTVNIYIYILSFKKTKESKKWKPQKSEAEPPILIYVCVCKLCVCVGKLCVWVSCACVWVSCVWVSAQPKTRTPHNDVGKKNIYFSISYFLNFLNYKFKKKWIHIYIFLLFLNFLNSFFQRNRF